MWQINLTNTQKNYKVVNTRACTSRRITLDCLVSHSRNSSSLESVASMMKTGSPRAVSPSASLLRQISFVFFQTSNFTLEWAYTRHSTSSWLRLFVCVIYCHSKINVVQSNRLHNLKRYLVDTCGQFRCKWGLGLGGDLLVVSCSWSVGNNLCWYYPTPFF
jgi:hypothetical protein